MFYLKLCNYICAADRASRDAAAATAAVAAICSPNKRSEEGFLLGFNRIAFEIQNFPSSPQTSRSAHLHTLA